MIHFNNVSKNYGDRVAVNQLNLDIQAGEVFGFLGPNGAGKTSTLKMLMGLTPITQGTITVDGKRTTEAPLEVRQILGYIPDRPFLYDLLTAQEFLNFVGGLYGMQADDLAKRGPEMLNLFRLGDRADELVGSFSHGMKQRLVMAGAFLHRPKALVVDEPMVGLDPQGSRLVKEIFKSAAHDQGMAVFLSTHSLETAEEVCDRVGILSGGNLVATGAVAELRDTVAGDDNLESIFLRITGGTTSDEEVALALDKL
jgi:ABC-2 type transport system ATP-binding protein